jgi:hypothetical protein
MRKLRDKKINTKRYIHVNKSEIFDLMFLEAFLLFFYIIIVTNHPYHKH